MSQTDLGKAVGVSREILGRCWRNEVLPSVEVVKKIADALEVSLDYLAGEGSQATVDKQTMKLIHNIKELKPAIKDKLFFLANAVINQRRENKKKTIRINVRVTDNAACYSIAISPKRYQQRHALTANCNTCTKGL